jgi:hypothetical protein
MAGPGFLVPVLGAAFYTADKFGTKKGGVNDWGKLRRGAIAERSNFVLWFLPGGGWGFCAALLTYFSLWGNCGAKRAAVTVSGKG